MANSRLAVFIAAVTLSVFVSSAFGQTPPGAVPQPSDRGGQISQDSASKPEITRGNSGTSTGAPERTGGAPASAVEKNINYGWF